MNLKILNVKDLSNKFKKRGNKIIALSHGVFDLIQVLTGGGPAGTTESIALYAYWNALRFLDFGYSSTIIMASFVLISLICVIAWIVLQVLIPSHPKSRGVI